MSSLCWEGREEVEDEDDEVCIMKNRTDTLSASCCNGDFMRMGGWMNCKGW